MRRGRLRQSPAVPAVVHAQPYYLTTISIAQANNIALDTIPGVVLGSTPQDMNGRLVYRVNVGTSYGRRAVFVDAYTGQIFAIERLIRPPLTYRYYYGYGY